MSTPPIQSSDAHGFIELPQDAGEGANAQSTSAGPGEDGDAGGPPRGPEHFSQHGDFYHANRMQQQLFGGGANGTRPHGSIPAQAQGHGTENGTPPRQGEGPHGGGGPRHDGTPRGEGHRGGDGPRGGDGGYRGDGPRGDAPRAGDGPHGQQRPGHGPDATPTGHSPRNAHTQPGNHVLPGNPVGGHGRPDAPQMPPWVGAPGMGSPHGHGHAGGFGGLGSFVGHALGSLLGGGGHAAALLLRPGEGLLSGLPLHAGHLLPNAANVPPTVIDVVRTTTHVVTQALPGTNAQGPTLPHVNAPNDPPSLRPHTPLQPGTSGAPTPGTAPLHDGTLQQRGMGSQIPQASQAAASTPAQATPATAAHSARGANVAGEPVHATIPAGLRGAANESTLPSAGQRATHGVDAPMVNPQAAAQNAARGMPGMQAVQAIQTGTLTLAFAPQMTAGIDEGADALSHAALFRGQGADGAEGLRDILGRNYVFSADGKLGPRVDERREVDPVQASRTEAIDENSFANDGELSTHELVWKVVVPAFVGVGTLLGGAAVGAATAAGSTGMASAFLLVSAASILGYGAVRAGSALREIADAGHSIHPFENPAARAQWLAAGTQSVGSLASLVMLLV